MTTASRSASLDAVMRRDDIMEDGSKVVDGKLQSPSIQDAREDSLRPIAKMQETPANSVNITPVSTIMEPLSAQIDVTTPADSSSHSRKSSRDELSNLQDSISTTSLNDRPGSIELSTLRSPNRHSLKSSTSSQLPLDDVPENYTTYPHAPLQYHHQPYNESTQPRVQRASQATVQSIGSSSSERDSTAQMRFPRTSLSRPGSTSTLPGEPRARFSDGAEIGGLRGSPRHVGSNLSAFRNSPDSRPMSYIDLLNEVPYHQQIAPMPTLNNSLLQSAVGSQASLLDTKKTMDMYRANVKKTTDSAVQYEFAIFMVNTAKDAIATGQAIGSGGGTTQEMIKEARDILARLSDRGYPFAQYYLADGFFSGFFNKEKPDVDKAFPLFIAASKHGHAEASYRAALCYEFAWGTGKSFPKAVQFHRNAASKGHPGAAVRLGNACLHNDMGLERRYREGVKWLKRAQEGADVQYNSGPYELGLLHITGFGDDIFKDESYAAQLLTQSAELGHLDANFRMGQSYELGLLGCPKDAALSIHFYTGAANGGMPAAMMALCAWYMVGAEPIMSKDEAEAYEWAKRAADLGLPKAEYAAGYFLEMGIGCIRDPLEANVYYVRAAEHGNDTARQRLAMINNAASGGMDEFPTKGQRMEKGVAKTRELSGTTNKDGKWWKW